MRLVLYLAAWSPALALLAYIARANGETSWPRAVALLGPACLVFAFAALSPWNLCRVRPLRFGEWTALGMTWGSASLSAGALFAGVAWYRESGAAIAAELALLAGLGSCCTCCPRAALCVSAPRRRGPTSVRQARSLA
jgi:hypothetical protein